MTMMTTTRDDDDNADGDMEDESISEVALKERLLGRWVNGEARCGGDKMTGKCMKMQHDSARSGYRVADFISRADT